MMGAFTPWKVASTTNQGFPRPPPEEGGAQKSTPLDPVTPLEPVTPPGTSRLGTIPRESDSYAYM